MVNPNRAYAEKVFPTKDLRDAYAEGLAEGISYECTSGSDPSRVRKGEGLIGGELGYWAYIHRGIYRDNGTIDWG
jgi:hypothetical protein